MRLVKPSTKYESAFRSMAQDYNQHNEERYGYVLEDHFDFAAYIQKLERYSNCVLNPNYAPSTTFWLIEGNSVLGVSRLRHYLVPRIEIEGGHIGYDVAPSYRGKGIGTSMLKLTIEKAKNLGLNKLLITCDSDNISSSKVILNNGGTLENEIISTQSGKLILRYWINVKNI